jgi:alpha-galactosidase
MDNIWLAYQLNRPDESDGIILAFRRKDCPSESIKVKLHGIFSDRNYLLVNEDTQENVTLSGEELKNGYTLMLKDSPGSLLIRYKRVP